MTDAALLPRQIGYEVRQFWRNWASAVFAVIFPIMFLVIFGSLNKGDTIKQLGGISYDQYYIPSILAFGVMGATYTNLAVSVSIRRDSGVLKRLRGTPLPRWIFLGGMIGNAVIVSIILTAVTIAVGVGFYGVTFYTARIGGLALDVVVGAACFCALGLAVSTLIPNADAAPAIVNALFFPLVFLSGTFFYIDQGSWATSVANIFPIRHFINATFAAFDPLGSGSGTSGRDLLVMLAWGAAGVVVALRRFRWSPSPA